ncbi:MAG: hypothetical protein HZB51_30890 [Chloroflexi bacterium]|nr:hypothetical protein [Chloroflexota bacterium]
MNSKPRLSSSQALFTSAFLIFFFTLLNGYLQNLVAGYRANTWLVLAGLIVEMSVTLWLARRWVQVDWDALEIAGFVLVVIGVAIYFIVPALPTLLPPTKSSDAVRVYLQVLFSYPNGTLVSWYPAGGAFVTAMFSHWVNVEPLRVLHPTAASFIALSAGAIYGMACALLPKQRLSKIVALIAPALLFVPWSYFAGTLDWEQYFFAQVFAQYFILAAVWYIATYAEQPRWVFAVLIGAALLGVVAAYPIFVALPLALFGVVVLFPALVGRGKGRVDSTLTRPVDGIEYDLTLTPTLSLNRRGSKAALITLVTFIGLLILTALALQQGGILELAAGQKSVVSDVGQGGVTNPSIDNLGGPIFLALVLVGAWLARRNAMGKTILGLLGVWIFQLVALLAIQPFLQLSGYRVDKTFYILVFPFALLAMLPLAFLIERVNQKPVFSNAKWKTNPTNPENGFLEFSLRRLSVAFIATILVLGASVIVLRPPKAFSPLTESEIQVAKWAKDFYMETSQIAYLDDESISAYWLTFGLWREKIPDEWFQWIPAGRKMGPPTFDEWLQDPTWHSRLLVRYVDQVPGQVRIVKQIGDSAIIDKDVPPDYGPKVNQGSALNFGSTLTLVGVDMARTTWQPGETITVALWTQTLYPPPATVKWRMDLVDYTGQVVGRVERDPFDNQYPLQRWPPGRWTRDVWPMPLDSRLQPGVYDLHLALFRTGGDLLDVTPLYATEPITPTADASLVRMKIPLPPPSAEELRAAKSIQAKLGENFALASYALQTDRASRKIHLALYWQGVKKSNKDYKAFVHVLDASGQVVAQKDASPLDGKYPTSIWDPGEIIKDEYELVVPTDAHAPFTIEIGMYDQPTQTRLPVGNSDHVEFKISELP